MSEHAHQRHQGTEGERLSEVRVSHSLDRRTPWVGWIWFAATMMILMGAFNAIEGLVALFKARYYVVGPENLLVFGLTGWGWAHLIMGALVVLTGIGLFTGAFWARVVAVVLVAVDAVGQLAFVTVQPFWSMIVLALCVMIIWAIVVHGAQAAPGDWR